MASIKIVLRKEIKNDGTLPLAIRVTKDRKSSYIYLDYSIKESDWDSKNHSVKKSHPNSVRLNNLLLKKLSDANNQSLELETNKSHVSSHSVRQKIKPAATSGFFAQGDLYLSRLKQEGKYNRYTADKSRIKHFKEFLKHETSFQDITVSLLERFKARLKGENKVSERTAVNHLVVIRSVFSQAIKEGIVDERYYPFGKGKVKIKFPESNKIGLSKDEIKALEAALLEGNAHHARNLWLFSFYLAGMRISDVLQLKWSDFQNNRLHYTMGKNSKVGSLQMPDKALKILEQYRAKKETKDELVFPELKDADLNNMFLTQRTIAFKTSALDKCLKTSVAPIAGIEKTLTMHIARHSFAQNAEDIIPIQMLQKLYRHSSITTTIGYQSNFIHKDADNALNLVIDF